MAVAARRETRMRVAEDRLRVEDRPDGERREPVDGEPLLLSPPRERHQAIVANSFVKLAGLAQGKGCRALPGLAVAMDDLLVSRDDARIEVSRRTAEGWDIDLLYADGLLDPPELGGSVAVRDLDTDIHS